MISRWRRKKAAGTKPLFRVISRRPKRLFAVGDIHGCVGELQALIEYLEGPLRFNQDDQLIFVGDYIDRGSSSRQVIDLLLALRAQWPETVFLKGNHEEMFMSFLGLGGESGEVFLANGGQQTVGSYGVDPGGDLRELQSMLPPAHVEFLKALEVGVILAEFLFVHAGVRPKVPLGEQVYDDCLWIRKEFLRAQHSLGKTVVFGHTPFADVMLDLPFKIGIDTGLIYGNKLSMVELVEGELYQVDFGEGDVRVSALSR